MAYTGRAELCRGVEKETLVISIGPCICWNSYSFARYLAFIYCVSFQGLQKIQDFFSYPIISF